MTIEEKISTLPQEARKEIIDFIDFLIEKNHRENKEWHLRMSDKSLAKIWDNTEDDVYSELL